MLAAPLIAGNDIRSMSAATQAILRRRSPRTAWSCWRSPACP